MRFVARSLDLTGTVIRAGYKELAMNVTRVRPVADRTIEVELRANEDAKLPSWTVGCAHRPGSARATSSAPTP